MITDEQLISTLKEFKTSYRTGQLSKTFEITKFLLTESEKDSTLKHRVKEVNKKYSILTESQIDVFTAAF